MSLILLLVLNINTSFTREEQPPHNRPIKLFMLLDLTSKNANQINSDSTANIQNISKKLHSNVRPVFKN